MARNAASGLILAALFFACCLLLWPILSLPEGSWYLGLQAYRYPYLLDDFKASFLAGHAYPRWLPGLMGHYGYPTFIYYAPGFWFLALPFALLFETTLAVRLTMLCILFAGAVGAYLLARKLCLNRIYALAASLVFITAPYGLLQLYWRGSISEWTAMTLLPWALLCYVRLIHAIDSQRPLLRPALYLGIACAIVLYAHASVAMWLAASLAAASLALLVMHENKPRLCVGIGCAVCIALALSAPYWASFIMLKNTVADGAFNKAYFQPQDDSVSRLNLLLFVPSVAGVLIARRQRMAVILALAVLPLLYMPLAMPFPSRALNMLVLLQLLGIVFFMQWLQVQKQNMQYALLAAIGVAAAVFAYPQWGLRDIEISYATRNYPTLAAQRTMDYQAFRKLTYQQFEDMTHLHEFMPIDARDDVPLRQGDASPLVEYFADGTDESIEINAMRDDDIHVCVASYGVVHINQFWFPGWRASIDGVDMPQYDNRQKGFSPAMPMQLDRSGRLQLVLKDKGRRQCAHIWYDAPPMWALRNIAAVMVLLASLALLTWCDRKAKATPQA